MSYLLNPLSHDAEGVTRIYRFDGVEGIGLWSMQKCCFDLLIDILWCIPADHELAQYLYGNPIMKYAKHLDAKQQEQMVRAVSFYIEVIIWRTELVDEQC